MAVWLTPACSEMRATMHALTAVPQPTTTKQPHTRPLSRAAAGRKRLKRRIATDESCTAHDGAVTGLAPTLEGLAWVSAGTDSRVRMWDSVHYRYPLPAAACT